MSNKHCCFILKLNVEHEGIDLCHHTQNCSFIRSQFLRTSSFDLYKCHKERKNLIDLRRDVIDWTNIVI